jgi:hypothetical protein
VYDDHAPVAGADYTTTIQLPGLVPTPGLSSVDVNFAADGNLETTDDDASCTGSLIAPTAPPGKLCMYPDNTGFPVPLGLRNVVQVNGSAITEATARGVFQVNWSSPAIGDMYVGFSYAYTAP